MILILNPLHIMSHASRACPVNIVLMRSETVKLENGIFTRHCKLHSESWKHEGIRKLACIFHRLDCFYNTVSIYLICHHYQGRFRDRSILDIHHMTISSGLDSKCRNLEFRRTPQGLSSVKPCTKIVLSSGAHE